MTLIPYPIPEADRAVLVAAGCFCRETADLFGHDSFEHLRTRQSLDMVIGALRQRYGVTPEGAKHAIRD